MATTLRPSFSTSASAAFAGVAMLPFVFLHLVGGAGRPEDWLAAALAQVRADFAFERPIQVLFALWLLLPVAWLVLAATSLRIGPGRVGAAKAQAIAACVLALLSVAAYSWQTAVVFGLPAFFALSHYRSNGSEGREVHGVGANENDA